MIIKFDHISRIARKAYAKDILEGRGSPAFKEIALANIPCKSALMHGREPSHDLYYFDADGDLPIEYIFYEDTHGKSGMSLQDGAILGHYGRRDDAIAFMESLLSKKVSAEGDCLCWNMRGVLDRRDYWLRLSPSKKMEPACLDAEGYGEIALIVKERPHIRRGQLTKEDSLVVNGRELLISFASSDSVDAIFELIRIKRREVGP